MTTPTPTAKPLPLTAQATLAHYQREAAHAAELVELRQLREEVARLREVNAELVATLEVIVERFGPVQDSLIFSKRIAIDKARAALAASKGA